MSDQAVEYSIERLMLAADQRTEQSAFGLDNDLDGFIGDALAFRRDADERAAAIGWVSGSNNEFHIF